MHRSTCILCIPCHVQHVAYCVRHTTHSMRHRQDGTNSLQQPTGSVQQATCPSGQTTFKGLGLATHGKRFAAMLDLTCTIKTLFSCLGYGKQTNHTTTCVPQYSQQTTRQQFGIRRLRRATEDSGHPCRVNTRTAAHRTACHVYTRHATRVLTQVLDRDRRFVLRDSAVGGCRRVQARGPRRDHLLRPAATVQARVHHS